MSEDFTPDQIEQARKVFSGACDFMLGVADLGQLPEDNLPEIAFAGRTQQLNFFNLGDYLTLVDMPGYGYAKVSKSMRKEWDNLIFSYLRGRANLRAVFILIDARHGLKDSDLHLMEMLDKAAVNYQI